MELDRETYQEFDLSLKQWEKETHHVFTTFKSKKFDKGDWAREIMENASVRLVWTAVFM